MISYRGSIYKLASDDDDLRVHRELLYKLVGEVGSFLKKRMDHYQLDYNVVTDVRDFEEMLSGWLTEPGKPLGFIKKLEQKAKVEKAEFFDVDSAWKWAQARIVKGKLVVMDSVGSATPGKLLLYAGSDQEQIIHFHLKGGKQRSYKDLLPISKKKDLVE